MPEEFRSVRAQLPPQVEDLVALEGGDVDGAYVAAYDAYRMAGESLLARQGLRATGGDGSHVTVEDAVSAQFAADIPAFVKPTFERLRRTRHSAQYFDPDAALSGVKALLAASPPDRFVSGPADRA